MKIEECIGRRDVNGVKLARLTGYHSAYVQRILRGNRQPGVKFLKALASVNFKDVEKRGPYNNSLAEYKELK